MANKLSTLLVTYDLNTEIGFLQCIESLVKDANSFEVSEGISFLISLEEMKTSKELPIHYLRLYRFCKKMFKPSIT
jgi:hypothetical protein